MRRLRHHPSLALMCGNVDLLPGEDYLLTAPDPDACEPALAWLGQPA